MNNGLLLFFGILVAMVSSWFGFVHSPQLQFGKQLPELDETTGASFPTPRSGSANRGRDIYRQNGCASCHTQQVRQSGFSFSVLVEDFGTNTVQVSQLLPSLSSQFSPDSPLPSTPYKLKEGIDLRSAEGIIKSLTEVGSVAMAVISPSGADIERGWGIRRTVGRDYLLDTPVMLGSQRIGPDLSNLGNRNPDANWHLVHLFQPRTVVENSVMPHYGFLFEKREISGVPAVDALRLDGELVLDPEGRQVIPRTAARDLVAYLLSLRLDEPIFEAPGQEIAKADSAEEAVVSEQSGATE